MPRECGINRKINYNLAVSFTNLDPSFIRQHRNAAQDSVPPALFSKSAAPTSSSPLSSAVCSTVAITIQRGNFHAWALLGSIKLRDTWLGGIGGEAECLGNLR